MEKRWKLPGFLNKAINRLGTSLDRQHPLKTIEMIADSASLFWSLITSPRINSRH